MSDTQSLRGGLPAAQDQFERRPRDEHRSEHVREKSDDQRDGESADRTGTELQQEQRRNQR